MFKSKLYALHLPDGRWKLLRDLVYVSELTGKTYRVPAGQVTDFASVPRLPFAFWLTGDTAHEAAVVHDYLYRTGMEPRAVADAIFREAMGQIGVPRWRRTLMWLGVRAFGWTAYSA